MEDIKLSKSRGEREVGWGGGGGGGVGEKSYSLHIECISPQSLSPSIVRILAHNEKQEAPGLSKI